MPPYSLVDLWDIETYPAPVLAVLRSTNHALMAYARNSDADRYRVDPADAPRRAALEAVAAAMAGATIRAWHYARLCPDEVQRILAVGLEPASPALRNERLRARERAGDLTADDVAALVAACELNADAFRVKTGAVFMTSVPRRPQEDYVATLLGAWGGEALARPHAGTALGARLARIGEPTVLEIALPFDRLPDSRQGLVAEAIEGVWLFNQGLGPSEHGRDLHLTEALPVESVRRVLRPADPDFAILGSAYPPSASRLAPDGALRYRGFER